MLQLILHKEEHYLLIELKSEMLIIFIINVPCVRGKQRDESS